MSALPAQAYAPVVGGAAVLPVWLSDGAYGIHPASIGLLSLQSSVPWAELKLGMQIRWFQFFTRKRAHRLYPAKYRVLQSPRMVGPRGTWTGGSQACQAYSKRCMLHEIVTAGASA